MREPEMRKEKKHVKDEKTVGVRKTWKTIQPEDMFTPIWPPGLI